MAGAWHGILMLQAWLVNSHGTLISMSHLQQQASGPAARSQGLCSNIHNNQAFRQPCRPVALRSGLRAPTAGPNPCRLINRGKRALKPGLGSRHVCDAHSAVPEARGLYDPANDKDACGVGFVGELNKKESRRTVTDALKMLARMAHRGACGCEENTGKLLRGGRCSSGMLAHPRSAADALVGAMIPAAVPAPSSSQRYTAAVGCLHCTPCGRCTPAAKPSLLPPAPAPRPPQTGDGAGILAALPDTFFHHVLMEEQRIKLPPLGQYAVGMVFLPQDAAQREAAKKLLEATAAALGHDTITWRTVPVTNKSLGQSAVAVEPVIEQWFINSRGSLMHLQTEQQVGPPGHRV